MRYVDTHTHLYDEAFPTPAEQDEAVLRAGAAGVDTMVVPDVCSRERAALLELCSRWRPGCGGPVLYPALGLHPVEVKDQWMDEVDMVVRALDEHPETVAVGEVGMDLYWTRDTIDFQQDAFRAQIDVALERNLPLIVHCRNATDVVFRILDDYRGRGLKGVFHALSGSVETFRCLDKYGEWMVGIGGVLTFKKASLPDTVRDIPLERIILETDSPYLAPVPLRGSRNESANIPVIAGFLARCKGVSEEEVAMTTTSNALKLFNIA